LSHAPPRSGLHTCKAGALPLEPYFQSILLWLFWDVVSQTICSAGLYLL
jgi:hypothetical protein